MKPILKISNPPARKNCKAGFTLTELLVILAVVAIIACVQCAALAGGRGRTLITECASHLRQFDLAMQLYARDNRDALPTGNPLFSVGNWPWDTPVPITDALEPYGATRNVLYCPANPDFNNYFTWNFAFTPPDGGFRILGYVTTLPGIPQIPSNLQNATLAPQTYWNGSTTQPPQLPSQRVLAADETVSYNGSYDDIPIGGLAPTVTQRTSHLDGKYPLGGNVAMLDGHVEWRPFSDMHVAFGSSGSPTFHW